MSRTRRSMATFATGLLWPLVMVFGGFIVTPFVLPALGTARYGAHRAAADWLTYITYLELGVGGALQALFAGAYGRQDPGETARLLKTGCEWYVRVAGAMAAATLVMAILVPVLINVEPELTSELRWGIVLSLLGLIWVPLSPFRYLAEAEQRGYIVQLLMVAQNLTILAGSLVFAVVGLGIPGQFLASVIALGLFSVPLAWRGIRLHPRFWKAATDGSEFQAIKRMNWIILICSMCHRIAVQSDPLFVARIMGAEAVASFTLTLRLLYATHSMFTSVGTATWAALAELYHQGQQERLALRLAELSRVTALLSCTAGVAVIAWNSSFVRMWVGPQMDVGLAVTSLTAVNCVASAVVGLWGWLFLGTGKIQAILPGLLAGTVVNVVVSYMGTQMFGFIGPALGTAAQLFVVSLWYYAWMLQRHYGISPRSLAANLAGPIYLAVPYAIVSYFLARLAPIEQENWSRWVNWCVLLACVGGTMLGYLVLAGTLVLSGSARREWLSRLRLLGGGR